MMSRDALDRFALTPRRITIVVLEEAAGRTTARFSFEKDDGGVNIIDDSSTHSGMPSWIELNGRYLHDLVKLRARGSANHLETLNLLFRMAVTAIHELAVSTPNLVRLLLHIVDDIPRNVMQVTPPLFCFVALIDSRLTPRTDADFETLQHAVINARDREYLEKTKTERVFRRWAEPSCVVRQPQDPVQNEDL